MKALEYHISPWRWTICKAASLLRKSACYGPLSPLRLVDRPMPQLPGPGWVRLRTLLGGICGTDLGLIMLRQHPATILQRFAAFPAILGHENVAVIDAVGDSPGDWSVGQRVCVDPAIGCAASDDGSLCRLCAKGIASQCERAGSGLLPPRALLGLNRTTGGSWAEYFVAHASQLHAVPDSVPDEQAVLLDPIASAAHAVMRRTPRPGEQVLVCGSGIIAMGIIASLRAMGCDNRVTIVARHEFQAELARKLGVSDVLRMPRNMSPADRYELVAQRVGGTRLAARFGNQALLGGFDLVYDTTGSGNGLTDAIKWTRTRGTLVLVGTSGIALVDTTPLWFDELEVIGANGRQIEADTDGPIHTYDLVLKWIASGRIDLSVLPIRKFRLTEYRSALRQLHQRGRNPVVKAVFDHRP
jgi:threonine dehydrogenase-like Zn-dependent dehydrogenase